MDRKLVLYIAMSLDGYIAKPPDYLSYLDRVQKEGEDYGYASEITRNPRPLLSTLVSDTGYPDFLKDHATNDVPMNTDCIADNWDLSAKRATSVVRMLQKKYNVDPSRMTAGGRSEYSPKTSNATADGKKVNRRTEIVILPKLDQFFKLASEPLK